MRAWTFSQRGEPSKVLSLTDLPAPTIPSTTSEEWILVKVAFAGLNVGSVFQMTLIPAFLRAKTCVPEMDLSGTVVEASASSQDAVVQRFQRGDKIVAMLPASHSLSTGTGALAEYVAIPAQYAVKKPPHVSFADGAGCLLTGMTAYQQVKESEIKPGDRVLVNAASGGIGSIVVQMAKKIVGSNGYVVGVCSGRNAQAVKDLGADEVGPTLSFFFCAQIRLLINDRLSTIPSTKTYPHIWLVVLGRPSLTRPLTPLASRLFIPRVQAISALEASTPPWG